MTIPTIGGLPQKVSIISMPGSVDENTPATSYVQLLDEDGEPYGVKQASGKPQVSTMPYLYDIAEGEIATHAPFRRFGVNLDVPISWETVTNQSLVQSYLTSAEQLKIVSTDTDDDGAPAGAGAQTLMLKGLDGNYDVISETVTLNGTTIVTTTKSFLRPLRASVVLAGASGMNEGTITIKNNASAVTLLQINAGNGQTNSAIWTVPAGNTGYIVSWNASESSTKGAIIGMWLRPFGQSWRYFRSYVLLDGAFFHPFALPIPLQEKTDIEIRALAFSAGAIVSAGFDGWYEAN